MATMSDTRLDLDAIRARADAASPGPWTWDEWVLANASGEDVLATAAGESASPEDAAFVAAARSDIPALLAEVERLVEAREGVRFALRRLRALLIASADRLDTPFTDMPERSPWTNISDALRALGAAVDALPGREVTDERDAYRAEVERLRSEVEHWKAGHADMARMQAEAVAKVERLRRMLVEHTTDCPECVEEIGDETLGQTYTAEVAVIMAAKALVASWDLDEITEAGQGWWLDAAELSAAVDALPQPVAEENSDG